MGDERANFNEALQHNIHLTQIKGKNMDKKFRKQLEAELKKNRAVVDMSQETNNIDFDFTDTSLQLAGKNIKDVGFLGKVMEKFDDLQILDLSNNKLGPVGAMNVAKELAQVSTIKKLILTNCDIRVQGLSHICQALSNDDKNSLEYLDIRKNQIDDGYLKLLLALLFCNPHISDIKYDLTKEENIQKFEWYNKKYSADQVIDLSKSGYVKIETGNDHHGHYKLWEKIIFCVYCAKSFLHAKHEAFRFKYDTASIKMIENTMMRSMRFNLYFQTVLYYFIMFGCPIIFLRDDNKGFDMTLYIIYASYAALNLFTEIYYVLKIQRKVKIKSIL